MKLGIFGLGKMGLNMALNLKDQDWNITGYDISNEAIESASLEGLDTKASLSELLNALGEKKVIILSTPAGKVTNRLVSELCDELKNGDIIIDSGNSYFKDSIANYELAKERGIHFLDCGTSGGIEGARNGACLMIGGDFEVFQEVEKVFSDLACQDGYVYTGKPGSGHYLKMVHNGIEYGMMQAVGEGFDVLRASEYDFDYEAVASVWNHGSVIRSWLMELIEEGFSNDPNLDEIKGIVNASGEAKWTVEEALDHEIPVPVIASSLFVRNSTQIEDSFSAKVVAALRNGFGGHEVIKK